MSFICIKTQEKKRTKYASTSWKWSWRCHSFDTVNFHHFFRKVWWTHKKKQYSKLTLLHHKTGASQKYDIKNQQQQQQQQQYVLFHRLNGHELVYFVESSHFDAPMIIKRNQINLLACCLVQGFYEQFSVIFSFLLKNAPLILNLNGRVLALFTFNRTHFPLNCRPLSNFSFFVFLARTSNQPITLPKIIFNSAFSNFFV